MGLSPAAKKLLIGAVSMVVAYSLCLFYSTLVALRFLYNYLTRRESKFWIPKDHSAKPKCLSDPAFGEHKFVTVNGVKLHYVTKGSDDKPLMLFIHGFPEFWYSWRYQLVEFSKDYKAVALDMRGYGESQKPSGVSPYVVSEMVEDIRGVIEALGYKKCVLVCHDWGAVIGWSFIQYHMDMVERYVMMGGPPSEIWRKSLASSLDQFLKSWYVFMFQMPMLAEFTFSLDDYNHLKLIGGNKFGEHFTEEDLEAYKHTFAQPGGLTAPVNYYRANLRFFNLPVAPKITKFAPGLFLLGEHDLYISKEIGPKATKIYQNLRYDVVPGANHFLQQDAPKETNAMIRAFLRGDA